MRTNMRVSTRTSVGWKNTDAYKWWRNCPDRKSCARHGSNYWQASESLGRGDELVVAKFSNAVRGVRELAVLLELCRVKVVRLVSVHDRIDSHGTLFPDTKIGDVLEMFGSLPEETAALRRASAHVARLKMASKKVKNQADKSADSRAAVPYSASSTNTGWH